MRIWARWKLSVKVVVSEDCLYRLREFKGPLCLLWWSQRVMWRLCVSPEGENGDLVQQQLQAQNYSQKCSCIGVGRRKNQLSLLIRLEVRGHEHDPLELKVHCSFLQCFSLQKKHSRKLLPWSSSIAAVQIKQFCSFFFLSKYQKYFF